MTALQAVALLSENYFPMEKIIDGQTLACSNNAKAFVTSLMGIWLATPKNHQPKDLDAAIEAILEMRGVLTNCWASKKDPDAETFLQFMNRKLATHESSLPRTRVAMQRARS